MEHLRKIKAGPPLYVKKALGQSKPRRGGATRSDSNDRNNTSAKLVRPPHVQNIEIIFRFIYVHKDTKDVYNYKIRANQLRRSFLSDADLRKGSWDCVFSQQ